MPVSEDRQLFMAMRWIWEAAGRKTDNIRIWETLAKELIASARNEVRDFIHVLYICEYLSKKQNLLRTATKIFNEDWP